MHPDIYLKQLQLGPMGNFVYLVGSLAARECMVVDPAWSIKEITQQAAADNMKITGALVTHYHPDHVGGHLWGYDIEGLAELIAAHPVPVYAQAAECAGIRQVTGLSVSDFKPCAPGDRIAIGDLEVTALHTPGHTPGSQCFLLGEHLVAGDTLFISGCGRVDLPGGDSDQMYQSLAGTLAKLPGDTVLYPGHNYDGRGSACLSEVKEINPYLSAKSLSDWRRIFGIM